MESSENDSESQPGFFKKILAIPCMKKSLLYGIHSGLGIGLAYFLLTGNVSKATNWGTGGFLLIMYGTWGVCRYKRAQEWYIAEKLQKEKEQIQIIDPKDV